MADVSRIDDVMHLSLRGQAALLARCARRVQPLCGTDSARWIACLADFAQRDGTSAEIRKTVAKLGGLSSNHGCAASVDEAIRHAESFAAGRPSVGCDRRVFPAEGEHGELAATSRNTSQLAAWSAVLAAAVCDMCRDAYLTAYLVDDIETVLEFVREVIGKTSASDRELLTRAMAADATNLRALDLGRFMEPGRIVQDCGEEGELGPLWPEASPNWYRKIPSDSENSRAVSDSDLQLWADRKTLWDWMVP